jgi:hypothetical protein
MQVSFGPSPSAYSAYVDKTKGRVEPGETGPVIDVETYYGMTRKDCTAGAFSLVSFFAPFIAFATAMELIVYLLSFWSPPLLLDSGSGEVNVASDPPVPVVEFCAPGKGFDPLLNSLLASTFHFSATHVALLAVCALAFLAAAASIWNVVGTHKLVDCDPVWARFNPSWLAKGSASIVVPLVVGCGVFSLGLCRYGPQIGGLFKRLFPIPTGACSVLDQVDAAKDHLYAQMWWGAMAVSIGVVSLIFAAALLGWRFETTKINGAWSDTYVLRHKINTLLTLFFIGSALLVVTNIALSSATDWVSGALDVIAAATQPDSKGDTGATGQSGAAAASSPTAPEKVQGAQPAPAAAPAKPLSPTAAEFNSLKALKTSVSSFAGALGSLLLILIFVPALYCLTGEIEIAGKTHASYDTAKKANKDPPPAAPRAAAVYARGPDGQFYEVEAAPGRSPEAPAVLTAKGMNEAVHEFELVAAPGSPPASSFLGKARGKIYEFVTQPPAEAEPEKKAPAAKWEVARWKTVQDWKEAHGLKLSFSDMTATFVAILAPLLSGSIIDLTKMALGG